MKIFSKLKNSHRKIFFLLVDISLLFISLILSYVILNPGNSIHWDNIIVIQLILSVFLIIYEIIFKVNSCLWRYANAKELCLLINVLLMAGISCLLVNLMFNMKLPISLILFSDIMGMLASIYIRILYKRNLNKTSTTTKDNVTKRPVAIIGSGSAGAALVREMVQNKNSIYTVWGMFDDDINKIGKYIDGVKIIASIDRLPDIIKESPVYDIILAIPTLSLERRREIISMCRQTKCRLKIMPDIVLSIDSSGTPLSKSIRFVEVEDLLGRTSINFKSEDFSNFLLNSTVLVTGGGGSIGSELCRQIAAAGAKKLIIFDMNENSSYLLQGEIKQRINNKINIVVEIGSMTDFSRVQDMFHLHKPDVVFHAAAHKHVPLMEICPYEAVKNNVFGTYNVVLAAEQEKVKKFVFISTDKAVNPTSIMGATKRYCEEMIRAFSQRSSNHTCFVSVRFGNVLGSSGSVIPIFREQIANGGPVTITDKRITRYFMTIPEAVGLVLKSGAMAASSETYILDMGEPIRIVDMAENLIRLSGFEPYQDIEIKEIGLRPGEKLYEELLVDDEQHTATQDSKIFIERNRASVGWDTILRQLGDFKIAISESDSKKVLSLMHAFIPDYKDAKVVNSTVDAKAITAAGSGAAKLASV